MPKPRILMLTPYLPYPPTSGGRSRTYNLVKHLRDRYEITLVCFGRAEEQAFDLSPMRELCELVIVDRRASPSTLRAAVLSLTSIKPITMRLYHTAEMEHTVAGLLPDQALVHVESFYMLQNLPAEINIPVLLSEPAVEYIAWWRHAKVASPFFMRPAIALEALKMRLWEPRAWTQATVVGVMSEVDAGIVKQATPGVATALAPNGVDVEYFNVNETVERDSQTAVYMGDYKYFPNTDAVLYFASEILPLVRAEYPRFQLLLLGKEPPPELVELGHQPDSGIIVKGLVDDTRPYLQGSALFVCPLRSGSGTRFKLLESLACGCPVVSTSVGCEGLNAEDGKQMLIRDTPRAFADAILDILNHPARGREIGQQGRAWVVRHHAWTHSAAQLSDAYDKLIGHEDPTLTLSRQQRDEFTARLHDALGDDDQS